MKFFKNLLTFIVFCNSFHFFSQKKPNVVMIVLDDLNDFTGYMNGHPQAETPNIDNLASQSVIFNNAHSNVPVCSPSRASFMTGIHPITSKFWGFGNALKNEVFMNSKSIPEFLKDNQDLMKIISSISPASIKDGGSGAFYIFLKKK